MIKDELCGWLLLHRRGVMGTVIFHLVLAIAFLGVKISQADVHVEMEIVMEAPDEEEVEQQRAEERRREEIRQRASGEEVERMLRSIAVNENIEAQSAQPMENISDYIDEIRAELAEAGGDGRYAARRNEHYRSDSLRWAQDREEQALDSLKSVFYAGESSVSYNLEGRYARFLPIPVFKCESGGNWAQDREEQALDSLKSVFYAGESSVSYNLEGRYARFLPIPVFKFQMRVGRQGGGHDCSESPGDGGRCRSGAGSVRE